MRLTRRPVLALLAGLAACSDPEGSYRNRIDTGWHRDDLDALMLRWHRHAPRPDGGFQWRFDRAWQPLAQPEFTLAAQARLVHAFAASHEFMPDAGHLAIARRGADFLLARFRDPAQGGLFHSIGTDDGQPRADTKHASDHAFALQALAEVYRVGGDLRYRDAAVQLCREIELGFSDADGGLHGEAGRDFQPLPGTPRTQAPVMHLFDALLALRAASGEALADSLARRLGDFATTRLLQGRADGGAFIPERYDDAWQPLPTRAAGGYIDLGHQFAWSHLLSAGAALSPAYAQAGERLLAYALAAGYDETGGGCGRAAFPDGGPADTRKGWWQQAECLHALLVAGQASGRNDLWRRYEQTQGLIKAQLVDAEHGGWRAAEALPCTSATSGSCRDEQPDPYPIVRLHQAALRPAV